MQKYDIMRLLDYCKISGSSVKKFDGSKKYIATGDVVDNQCLSTRGQLFGYNGASAQSLNSNYWYGTDFEYDANTVFINSSSS